MAFKMKGHSLPGPNKMKSPVKNKMNVNDGLGRSWASPKVTKEQAATHNKDDGKSTHHDAEEKK